MMLLLCNANCWRKFAISCNNSGYIAAGTRAIFDDDRLA